ncbi:hypothetical protein [Streptomyces sp. NPDC059850]|uniref:hypothetical protein n=1 Tax=Streptomyces sp. NPDC059850 TaxID=3346970 RepID=UPI003648635B
MNEEGSFTMCANHLRGSLVRTFATVGLLVTGALLATGCQSSDATPPDKSVNGTFTGELSSPTPGTYTVKNKTFHVTDDTKMTGYGIMCVPAEGKTSRACTPGQLQAAVDDDLVIAQVTIVDGVATRMIEK